MVWIEFLQDYKCGHEKGCVKEALPHFAQALIEAGIAKAIDRPKRNKMITKPPGKKNF